jgi:PPP family 3-phenylpropionic acid transporter
MYTMWGVVAPSLSILIENAGYGPRANGYFQALYNCMGMVGPLLIGPLADRLKRPRLFLALLCLLVPLSIFPLAYSRAVWSTALSICGLAVGLWSIVPIADAFTSTFTRGDSGVYGRIRAFGSLGFICMALLFQFIPGFDQDSSLSVSLASLPATALTLAAVILLPRDERDPSGMERPAGADKQLPGTGVEERIKPVFWIGLAVIAFGRLACIPFNGFLSLYVQDRVRWNAVSAVWALGAMAELPFIFCSGWFLRKIGLWGVMLVSLTAIIARLAIYAFFPVPAGVVAGQLLHSLSFGLFYPASVAFVARTVPQSKRALGMAMNLGLAMAVPNLLGNAVGGNIIEKLGWEPLFISFMAPAALGIAAALAFLKPLKRASA